MRAKLGETLSSIQRLNAPFGQATTPSLEAFRAYALGDEAHQKGNDIPEAEDHYKRALELDPKLAMAWARLGVIRLNSGAIREAADNFTRAYQLSDNVSEHEKLYIAGHYYTTDVGDLNKASRHCRWPPRSIRYRSTPSSTSAFFFDNGEFDKASRDSQSPRVAAGQLYRPDNRDRRSCQPG